MRQLLVSLLMLSIIFGCKKDSKDDLSPSGTNGKSVGASAHDLLSSSVYKTIRIELDYMPGMRPSDGTIANLKSFIVGLTNKSGGVVITESEIPTGGRAVYSIGDIEAIEKSRRTQFNTDDAVGVYFLVVDGDYSESNVLGIAYKNTSMALFGRPIHSNSGGLLQVSREKLESTVIEHEFGHVLGLVDVGSAMQTNHKANGSHCNNTSCLMYYQVETTDVLTNLVNSSIPTLDQNCKNDLKANGGR